MPCPLAVRKLPAFLLFASLVAGGCASTGGVPRPFPVPGGHQTGTGAPTSLPAGPADGYAISSAALALRGTPYRDGGSTPDGFDCSGFTQYVFSEFGITLPREVREQYAIGRPVETPDIAPGDLIFFSTVASGASHVGIAVGGDRFVHAPSSRGVVRIEQLNSSYWSARFLGARRVE
jgi:cell wall-associated NlpC family hydrolase